MRVADRTTSRNYLKYLNKAKYDLAQTTQRIASGKRFTAISEDVAAGTKVLRSRMDLYKSEKQLDNVQSIKDELTSTESTLTTMNDILTDIHSSKLVKGMSESTGESGRIAIANEIKALKEQVLSLANTKYGKKFIFGGSNASYVAPFKANAAGELSYNGINVDDILQNADGSFYYVDNSGGTPVNTPIPQDDDVFMDIGLGIRMQGNDTDGESAFKISYSGLQILGFGKDENGNSNNIYGVLNEIESALRSGDMEKLGELDTQIVKLSDKFLGNITEIGAKTSYLDVMETRLTNETDAYKSRIDRLMGTDDAEEASTQTMNDYVLKAVLQMGANILPASLLDYLG